MSIFTSKLAGIASTMKLSKKQKTRRYFNFDRARFCVRLIEIGAEMADALRARAMMPSLFVDSRYCMVVAAATDRWPSGPGVLAWMMHGRWGNLGPLSRMTETDGVLLLGRWIWWVRCWGATGWEFGVAVFGFSEVRDGGWYFDFDGLAGGVTDCRQLTLVDVGTEILIVVTRFFFQFWAEQSVQCHVNQLSSTLRVLLSWFTLG